MFPKLKQQVQHRHMFTHWEVNRGKLASRVLFQQPAHYLPETILSQHVRERAFSDRKLRRRAPDTDLVAFQTKCNELRLLAAGAERANPVSFTFFPSNAVWLPPGRSTCFQACCKLD